MRRSGRRAASSAAAGRPVLLAAGRLAEQKGFGVLLDAAAAWQHRDPVPRAGDRRATARWPGSWPRGPPRARLEVVFLGRRSDIPALLAAADVVVVPSRWEARALIVQEAMRLGRPIVATRVGGIPDLTGEDGALLVPPGDPGQLAAAVLAVLDDGASRPGSVRPPGRDLVRCRRSLTLSRRRFRSTEARRRGRVAARLNGDARPGRRNMQVFNMQKATFTTHCRFLVTNSYFR